MTFCLQPRKLLLVLACAPFIFWLNGARTVLPEAAPNPSTSTVQGAAALDQLKQTGQFTSLQAAMQQARRSVSYANKTPLGRPAWHAPNPAAGYDAYVHEDGVSLVVDKAAPVSLRLQSHGYGADLRAVTAGVVSGEQQTINIERGSGLREWYVNGAEGLEQGFTLNAPPIGEKAMGAKLRLALQISAGWRAVPGADDQRVSLLNEAGAILQYGKLAAWDAQGQVLSAALTVEHERIVIEVDDAQAVYPVTIDPIFTQQAKLSAPDAAANDSFGYAVALSGNTALISAPFDDVTFADQGSAYVFVRSSSSWSFQAKLTATDGANSNRFGYAVALSGDTAVVGTNSGSAYVFTRSGTSWSQQQKLTGNDGGFGISVALSGESLIIGANFESIGGAQTGAAYVFTRSGTTPPVWTQQQKLTANDGLQGDNFGLAVALDSDTALVGAPGDDIGAINNRGSVYVFARSGTVWTQQQKLLASDGAAEDGFGNSVALNGDTAAVGAYLDDSGANINQGAAYVFTRNGTTWTQQQKLTASDGAANDFFGYSVALSGDVLVASALGDGFGATSGQGSLYVFARSGASWTQQNKIVAADGVNGDNLGRAVALGGDTVLVGAAEDDGAFTNQGAAYVFVLCENSFTQQQQLLANDGAPGDQFGRAVALSGETAVVGVANDDVGANADQGSVYVFTRSSTVWTLQQKLTASDGAANDEFGKTVALSSDTVVVGAATNDIGANSNQGSAYVFTRSGTTWAQQQILTASDGLANDSFGSAVAFSGNTAVVGALSDDVGANVNQGSAYVFIRSGTVWTQQQKLTASDGAAGDAFGNSVALDSDTALVGAVQDDIGANDVQGSAYVFTRSGTAWSQQQKFIATDGAVADFFGISVALSGDTVVVGAYEDDIGANGNQGSAYVFTRNGAVWSQQQKLTANDGTVADHFGHAVALSGDTVVVGAPQDGIGTNNFQGSAYVFTRSGTVWTQQQKLTANDGNTNDAFGFQVALSNDTILAGAFLDSVGANTFQGSAYVFACPGCPAITLNPASLPNGAVGTSYNQTITATGSTGPFQFSLSSGALPPGFSLAQNGILSGTPMTAGTYSFSVTATILSSLCPGSRAYTLTITPPCPAITINPTNSTLPNGRAGLPYTQTFTQTGGAGTATFSISAGTLPTGLTLAAGGLLNGTPTVNGTFNFTVQATDTNGCTGARAYTLLLLPPCPAITINPATLANGFVGTAYSQTLTATGGTAPYTFAVSAGTLPNGLALASGGGLTGTPNTVGTFTFTVTATDNGGCAGVRAYTVIVSGTGLQFFPLPAPVRLLDTRLGTSPNACSQPNAPIAGGTARTQPGRNFCGIPANAAALTGNVTTVLSGGGFLTLFPSDAVQPTVASTNYNANEIINNVFTVGLGASDGAFKVFALTTTDVVIDVTGYYAPPNTGGLFFHPLPAPVRLLETRAGFSGCVTPGAPLVGNTESTQQASSACTGIPASARALVGNATTVGPQGGGFLTIFPADATRPLVASSNFNVNQVVNGPFAVGLAANGQFKIFTTATTDLVVDVLGYYSNEASDANGAGLLLTPLAHPIRLLETRAGQPVGCFKPGVPLAGGAETAQPARGACDGLTIPDNALGVVGNATIVLPGGPGFLTLWPSSAARPLVATLNYNTGAVGNRHFIVGLGNTDGAFKLFTQATSHLVLDLAGYFAP